MCDDRSYKDLMVRKTPRFSLFQFDCVFVVVPSFVLRRL